MQRLDTNNNNTFGNQSSLGKCRLLSSFQESFFLITGTLTLLTCLGNADKDDGLGTQRSKSMKSNAEYMMAEGLRIKEQDIKLRRLAK